MNTGAPEILQERKLWGTVLGAAVTVEMARMARARSKVGDLIVSHWLTPTAFAGLAAHRNNGCPVHAYAHGSDVALLEAIPQMVGQRLVRLLDRQLKGMTFVSGQLQDRFNQLLGRGSAHETNSFAHGLYTGMKLTKTFSETCVNARAWSARNQYARPSRYPSRD